MIIYGTRSRELGSEWIQENCPKCNASNSLNMHIFQRYAHIFWIPTFPIGKIGISQCSSCQDVKKENQMQPEIKSLLPEIKSRTKAPIWMWSGMVLVIAILGVLAVTKNL